MLKLVEVGAETAEMGATYKFVIFGFGANGRWSLLPAAGNDGYEIDSWCSVRFEHLVAENQVRRWSLRG